MERFRTLRRRRLFWLTAVLVVLAVAAAIVPLVVDFEDTRHFNGDPSWSPDGARIVFTSNRDGNPEIYVMVADGSGVSRLTDHPANDSWPSWSPDGTRIVFSSMRADDEEIYMMTAAGSHSRPASIGTSRSP